MQLTTITQMQLAMPTGHKYPREQRQHDTNFTP